MKIIMMFLACLFLAGCANAQEVIDKAIAETQTAIAPEELISPSPTLNPTSTLAPTNTFTPMPTITPTPDLRVIEGEPMDFILQRMDLPEDGGYYLPGDKWVGRLSNEEVISTWNAIEAKEFITKSKRIDGWFVNYKRSAKKTTLPEKVYCLVEKYSTFQGANLTLTEEFNTLEKYLNKYKMTKSDDAYPELGDMYVTYYREWKDGPGDVKLDYLITATYYNFSISCKAIGFRGEFETKLVAKMVGAILERLKNSNLVLP